MPKVVPLPKAAKPKPKSGGQTLMVSARHERFCRFIAHGHSQTKSYADAFGVENQSTAASEGCKLAKIPKIQARVREILQEQAEAAQVSPDWIVNRLKRNAEHTDVHASVSALKLLGQITGSLGAEQAQASTTIKIQIAPPALLNEAEERDLTEPELGDPR